MKNVLKGLWKHVKNMAVLWKHVKNMAVLWKRVENMAGTVVEAKSGHWHAGGISRMWSCCGLVNPSLADSLVPFVGGNLMTFRLDGNRDVTIRVTYY